MPAQRRRFWDHHLARGNNVASSTYNASPEAEILGRHTPRSIRKDVLAYNASPEAEILGPPSAFAARDGRATYNASPEAEILGPTMPAQRRRFWDEEGG